VATFTSLSYNVAETITIGFSTAGLTNATSDSIIVSPAAADRLIFSTQPGGVSRVGSILATQPVIKSRDAFGNLSTVGLPGNLPVSLTLSSGSGSLAGTTVFDIGTAAANGVIVCTNVQCTTAGTNKQLSATASGLTGAFSATFVVGGVDPAVGAAAISADTVGGSYTTLTGPVYDEVASGDTATGTIILNVRAVYLRYQYTRSECGDQAPEWKRRECLEYQRRSQRNFRGGHVPSTNQITFTVTSASSAGVTCSLTWTNVRVRPLAGTPLASGNLTKTGTSAMAAVSASSTSLGH